MKKTLIVCLLSNKGGSGKTTISTAIAGELHRRKLSGLLIDLDPQGSASRWHQQRDDDEPGVIPAQAHQLPGIVERANEAAADFLIIDTPPHRPLSGIRVKTLTSSCDACVAGLLGCTTKKNSEGVRSIFSV